MTDLDADLADVRSTLDERMAVHRDDLEALVRIPSVSADPSAAAEVRRSAEAVRDLLTARGLRGARLLEVDGAHPAVYAEHLEAGPQAPTVLLYAHHDVQPAGDRDAWRSGPFDPQERDGRLFGRGAADDKAGILVHVAAVDAWLRARGSLPLNVKVIIEGEEETGSAHLPGLLAAHAETLRADAIVLTDSVNWKVGVPAITYLLRGLVDCEVELRGLDHALHSGMYGGPVPDPLTGLVKLLASLTDERGAIAVPGFDDDVREPSAAERARVDALAFDEAAFREEAGLRPGVQLGGDPTLHPLERLWMRPNATIIGLDAPAVAEASNTLVPSARARVSVRLAPGQDPERARRVLSAWLTDQAPWGMEVTVHARAGAGPFVCDPEREPWRSAFAAAGTALEAAYGHPAVHIGVGGTIPFVEPFAAAFAGPDGVPAPALLLGVEDPDTRAHGIDESLHLGDWRNACLGEAYLLATLADTLRDAV